MYSLIFTEWFIQYNLFSRCRYIHARRHCKKKRLAKTHNSTHTKSATDILDFLNTSSCISSWSEYRLFLNFDYLASYVFLIYSPINNDFCQFLSNIELRWRFATAVPKHNLNQSSSIVATLTQSPWGNKRKRMYSVCACRLFYILDPCVSKQEALSRMPAHQM